MYLRDAALVQFVEQHFVARRQTAERVIGAQLSLNRHRESSHAVCYLTARRLLLVILTKENLRALAARASANADDFVRYKRRLQDIELYACAVACVVHFSLFFRRPHARLDAAVAKAGAALEAMLVDAQQLAMRLGVVERIVVC